MSSIYETILYSINLDSGIATITLNRPERLNAINMKMPQELKHAVDVSNSDSSVRVIVVKGSGPGFCAGYDLVEYAEGKRGVMIGSQAGAYDPLPDYYWMSKCTECFMSLFHSHKPTIAQVHGACVAGGSDIALCADFVIMSDDAKIGYPPARVWGCPTTAQWAIRLGIEKAKYLCLTGDVISGKEASSLGLVFKSCPIEQLEDEVGKLAKRMCTVPSNQLWMNKVVINQIAGAELGNAQRVAVIFDGLARHTPEGLMFQQIAAKSGWKNAVRLRDSGEMMCQSRL